VDKYSIWVFVFRLDYWATLTTIEPFRSCTHMLLVLNVAAKSGVGLIFTPNQVIWCHKRSSTTRFSLRVNRQRFLQLVALSFFFFLAFYFESFVVRGHMKTTAFLNLRVRVLGSSFTLIVKSCGLKLLLNLTSSSLAALAKDISCFGPENINDGHDPDYVSNESVQDCVCVVYAHIAGMAHIAKSWKLDNTVNEAVDV